MLKQIVFINNRINQIRKIIIFSTIFIVTTCAMIAIIFVLQFASVKLRFDDASTKMELLSNRLNRNYDAINSLIETTKFHCVVVHGVDPNIRVPEANPPPD